MSASPFRKVVVAFVVLVVVWISVIDVILNPKKPVLQGMIPFSFPMDDGIHIETSAFVLSNSVI